MRYRSSSVFSLGRWSSRFPTALACAVVLRLLPPVVAPAYGTLTLSRPVSHPVRPALRPLLGGLQPQKTCLLVWAAPRSLATTSGILSFPPGTEMFQFPRCPSSCEDGALADTGFPHSDIVGWSRLHTADRRFSQCTTSFFGTGRPGIPRVPCLMFVVFDGEAEPVRPRFSWRRVSRRLRLFPSLFPC